MITKYGMKLPALDKAIEECRSTTNINENKKIWVIRCSSCI